MNSGKPYVRGILVQVTDSAASINTSAIAKAGQDRLRTVHAKHGTTTVVAIRNHPAVSIACDSITTQGSSCLRDLFHDFTSSIDI